MANTIELKTVGDLLGMRFFIPSYQRGYRWTKQQVEDLFNDVNEFIPEKVKETNEITWYCLQPLVVSKMDSNDPRVKEIEETNNWYEVIDGQQRLTTIFIILKLMNFAKVPTIQYQTRPKSSCFLNNINNEKDESNIDNIDFHFMLSTKKVFVNDLKGKIKEGFIEKLINSCKVICKGMGADALRLTQFEMASEWDRMEQTLHDNSFWYFINPEPEDARFNSTRIDFLLEMILRYEKNDKNEFEKELRLNDYFIFSTYSNKIIEEGWEKQWRNIQFFFRIMKSWYDDRRLYHYVGYLMNLKGGDKMAMLRDLLCDAEQPKDKFLFSLIERCQKTIGIGENQHDKIITEVNFANWEYGKNNNEIHNVLLLFNLATTQNQISEVSRYPFDKHYEAAKKKWSLEHIHAQNETKANWDETQFNKIKGYLKSISVNGIDKLNEYLSSKKSSEDINDGTYRAIMSAFMGNDVKMEQDDNGNATFSSNFEKDDHLTNMALLQGDKNAAFNNKLYPEKKAKLAEYENVENESLFVPICTRNVFFKHYSPNSTNPLLWDEQAGIEYVRVMTKVVAAYLQLEAILPNENKDIKYGVKVKESEK